MSSGSPVRPFRPLVFDVSACSGENARRGIGRYVSGLARVIHQQNVDCILVGDRRPGQEFIGLEDLKVLPRSRQVFRENLNNDSVFLVGSMYDGPGSFVPIPYGVRESGSAVATIFYDAIPHQQSERYIGSIVQSRFYESRDRLVRSADLVLCISSTSADAAVSILDCNIQSVHTIGTGVDDFFFEPLTKNLHVRENERKLVLSVGGFDDRKNIANLLRSWALLPFDVRRMHQLTIVARLTASERAQWDALRSSIGLAEYDVKFVGEVSDAQLRDFYRAAVLNIFPSFSEGFGIPVAEAACCGLGTLTANVAPQAEILSLPRAQFDPMNVQDMARCIIDALCDAEWQRELHAVALEKSYSFKWETVVTKALKVLMPREEDPLSSRKAKLAKRVAFVGPFGDSRSGIGAYNERVLPELQTHLPSTDIEVFVDRSSATNPWPRDCRRRVASEILRHEDWSRHDVGLFVLGTSEMHSQTAQALRGKPLGIRSIVWLHDASLVGMVLGLAHRLPYNTAVTWIRSIFELSYPESSQQLLSDDEIFSPESLREHDVRFLSPWVGTAERVIVSSILAKSLVEADLARAQIACPPIDVVPIAFRPFAKLSSHSPRRNVIVLGYVSAEKQPERAIRIFAAAQSLGLPNDVNLLFIGDVDANLGRRLMTIANDLGVHDRVAFTGFVSNSVYENLLCGAALALMLRGVSNGEMSGAISDCVASGIPVLTTLQSEELFHGNILRVLPVDSTNEELAQTLVSMVHRHGRADDEQEMAELAASWSFDHVAAAVSAILDV